MNLIEGNFYCRQKEFIQIITKTNLLEIQPGIVLTLSLPRGFPIDD